MTSPVPPPAAAGNGTQAKYTEEKKEKLSPPASHDATEEEQVMAREHSQAFLQGARMGGVATVSPHQVPYAAQTNSKVTEAAQNAALLGEAFLTQLREADVSMLDYLFESYKEDPMDEGRSHFVQVFLTQNPTMRAELVQLAEKELKKIKLPGDQAVDFSDPVPSECLRRIFAFVTSIKLAHFTLKEFTACPTWMVTSSLAYYSSNPQSKVNEKFDLSIAYFTYLVHFDGFQKHFLDPSFVTKAATVNSPLKYRLAAVLYLMKERYVEQLKELRAELFMLHSRSVVQASGAFEGILADIQLLEGLYQVSFKERQEMKRLIVTFEPGADLSLLPQIAERLITRLHTSTDESEKQLLRSKILAVCDLNHRVMP